MQVGNASPGMLGNSSPSYFTFFQILKYLQIHHETCWGWNRTLALTCSYAAYATWVMFWCFPRHINRDIFQQCLLILFSVPISHHLQVSHGQKLSTLSLVNCQRNVHICDYLGLHPGWIPCLLCHYCFVVTTSQLICLFHCQLHPGLTRRAKFRMRAVTTGEGWRGHSCFKHQRQDLTLMIPNLTRPEGWVDRSNNFNIWNVLCDGIKKILDAWIFNDSKMQSGTNVRRGCEKVLDRKK